MVATFVVEAAFAVWVAIRYRPSLFRATVVTMLICLATFQLVEFQVCAGTTEALLWTKVGVAGITMLPALGMHLIGQITRPSVLVPISYVLAVSFALILAFLPGATEEATCSGNYVLLHIRAGWVDDLWSGYYALFLALAVLELVLRLVARPHAGPAAYSTKLIALTLVAYLSFILPMAVVDIVDAALRVATPSIMCGFAVLMALLMALWIVPLYTAEHGALDAARATGSS